MSTPFVNANAASIKEACLAAEARIIRQKEAALLRMRKRAQEENKTAKVESLDEQIRSLHHHRTAKVRQHARAVHLARMFLRGVPFSKAEALSRAKVDFEAIHKNASTFGTAETFTLAAWLAWKAEAEKHQAAYPQLKAAYRTAFLALNPRKPKLEIPEQQRMLDKA